MWSGIKQLTPDENGKITDKSLEVITDKTKLVAVSQVSNVLGRVNDIKHIAEVAHAHGAVIVADGAQSVPHMPVNVTDLDVDFLVFSGHKMLAPMGIGALYGKKELLDKMPPFLSGGEMIEIVHWDRVKYAEVPHKFEAGTVNTGGAVGLHAAIDYINKVGFDTIMAQERKLTKIAVDAINDMKGVNLIGSSKAEDHEGIVTFTIDGVHPHDVASILDSHNKEICIIQITKIEIVKFESITEKFSIEEGDVSLENWKRIHTEYYSSILKKIGLKLTGETRLLCEWFTVVVPKTQE